MDRVGAVLIWIGRLFQSLRAAMANGSSLDFSLVLETTKSLKLAEGPYWLMVYQQIREVWGAKPFKDLTNKSNLK